MCVPPSFEFGHFASFLVRHCEISACHSSSHVVVQISKVMQEKAKLVLRLSKDVVPPHHTTIDDYPECKRILNIFEVRNRKTVPVSRSEINTGLGTELNRAPLEICERVYGAFGVTSYEDLFPMSSIPDLEEDEVSEAPEEYEEEEKRVKLKLSNDIKNKKSSSSLRDSPQPHSRSTGKSTSAHKTAATDTTKPRIPNQVPITTFGIMWMPFSNP